MATINALASKIENAAQVIEKVEGMSLQADGDVLIVTDNDGTDDSSGQIDNMTVSHGREPFEGDRLIVVAMTEAQSAQTAGAGAVSGGKTVSPWELKAPSVASTARSSGIASKFTSRSVFSAASTGIR